MIPYEVDPSLHTGKPTEPVLDDGFSAPAPAQPLPPSKPGELPVDLASDPLGDKSGF